MNILLIGGSSSLINNLIIKFNKEGHRVSLLTGSKYSRQPYQKVFERYDFPYDSTCLDEIFDSADPDVTIFLGAYDSNFKWITEEAEAVRFSSSLMNILMAYAMTKKGRFIYLSCDDVYGRGYEYDIPETEPTSGSRILNMVHAQAEEMCMSFRKNRGLDILTLRLDNLFGIPNSKMEIRDICCSMCLEAIDKGTITISDNNVFSLLYDTDAVEFIYQLASCHDHKENLYNISSGVVVTAQELAEIISDHMEQHVDIVVRGSQSQRRVLSRKLYESEFGIPYVCDLPNVVGKIVEHMNRNKYLFFSTEEQDKTVYERAKDKAGWFFKLIFPFVENLIVFAVVFILTFITKDSSYFKDLDLYLLYVLLFAIVYGQQQALFSGALSVVGFCVAQISAKSVSEVMLSANTYIWIAELFIVGLAVGYMRDYISKLKLEQENEKDFLTLELSDIKDINNSNMRVKDALQTEIINQNDSIGKIYNITSTLDQYSPEEVLFYAAEMVGELVKSNDVAIYTVSNETYARLFSATSESARTLGNSVRYKELGEMYQVLSEHNVYINRRLDEDYPMMAHAIFGDGDRMQLIIMIWSLPWERMTLGQANQLVVISALIQNALLRANRYLDALEGERYIEGSTLLEVDAFVSLINAFMEAAKKGLTHCMVIKIQKNKMKLTPEDAKVVIGKLRQTDYVGRLPDGEFYALLTNTRREEADVALQRLSEIGFQCQSVEDNEES